MDTMEREPILQRSDKIGTLPANIRMDFIVKVYAIVMAMLLVTFGIAAPFVFNPDMASDYLVEHPMILITSIVLLVGLHCFHLCMICGACCGCEGLLRCYMSMFRTVPFNYIFIFVYSACIGVVVGIVSMMYTVESVCLVFILTAVILVVLTVYAVRTDADFSHMGPYAIVAVCGVLLIAIVGLFVPLGDPGERILSGLCAIVFGFVIVYDTQLIFGHVRGEVQKLEFTVDMYAFAAFDLYLDFVNFFLQVLRALGQRR